MEKRYDVLGAGIAAVDDLIYVTEYPPIDCKIPVHGSTRQGVACLHGDGGSRISGRTSGLCSALWRNDLARFIASALDSRGVDISHIVKDPDGGPYHSILWWMPRGIAMCFTTRRSTGWLARTICRMR